MSLTPFNILVGVAAVLAVISLVKPSWPLVPVAVLLVCVGLLVGK